MHEFPPEKFRLILAVMLEAPFRLARAALPHMYDQGFGRIVNISSVHGLRASPFKSAYVAAKHGLEGLSKVIALEGGPHGVWRSHAVQHHLDRVVELLPTRPTSRDRTPAGAADRRPGPGFTGISEDPECVEEIACCTVLLPAPAPALG